MAYYVTLKEKKDYKIVDVTKANIFNKYSNYKQEGACSLKEIDAFTTQFNDEVELRMYLFKLGLIDPNDINKDITIRLKFKDKYKKVMYDILYQNELLLLFPDNLIKETMNRSNDYEFLTEFVKRFYDYRDCRTSINELGCYVNDSKRTGYRNKYLDERLYEVTKELLYDSEGNIKYLNLHTMVAFIKNYDKKQEQTKLKIKPKMIKKTKEVTGQISLFD